MGAEVFLAEGVVEPADANTGARSEQLGDPPRLPVRTQAAEPVPDLNDNDRAGSNPGHPPRPRCELPQAAFLPVIAVKTGTSAGREHFLTGGQVVAFTERFVLLLVGRWNHRWLAWDRKSGE